MKKFIKKYGEVLGIITLGIISVVMWKGVLNDSRQQEMLSPLVNTPTPYPSPTVTPAPTVWNSGYASYYGERFRGQTTASGEIFNPDDLTCAHRTLPFGTILELKYKDKIVPCKVNDRGPYISGRVLDLSRQTFMALSDLSSGVIYVQWRIVK